MQNISLNQTLPRLRKNDWSGGSGLYGHLLAPAAPRPYAVFEVIVGMILILMVLRLVRPDDPLLSQLEFPWIWLVASIFSLRYGAILGVVAGLCIAAGWFYDYSGDYSMGGMADFPVMLFVGGMAQLVITGHFCDVWAIRTRRLKALNSYLDDSLVSLTNQHYLLKASHERLERDSLLKPYTLRDAFEQMRQLPCTPDGTPMPHAAAMLTFVATGCQISQASLFVGDEKGLSREPIAFVGAKFELDARDPLLKECLRLGELVHLRQSESDECPSLVCAPVETAAGRLLGVLVIKRMAFLALNEENLQLLRILLSFYADGIDHETLVRPVLDVLPQCPEAFALELAKLARLQTNSGVRSSLVAFVFPRSSFRDALINHLEHCHRALDLMWEMERSDDRVVLVLLPLTDDAGVDGYLARVDLALQAQINRGLVAAGVQVFRASLDNERPAHGLRQLLLRCNRHD